MTPFVICISQFWNVCKLSGWNCYEFFYQQCFLFIYTLFTFVENNNNKGNRLILYRFPALHIYLHGLGCNIDVVHINEVHICVPGSSYVL